MPIMVSFSVCAGFELLFRIQKTDLSVLITFTTFIPMACREKKLLSNV